jgi:hypothetical protein
MLTSNVVFLCCLLRFANDVVNHHNFLEKMLIAYFALAKCVL